MADELIGISHEIGKWVDVRRGEQRLLRYVYEPDVPQYESPKPYIHPVRTLAGEVVTGYRPHDHLWHKGIQMTAPYLSGQNFWGGPSFVKGEGYVALPNNGSMSHVTWEDLSVERSAARLVERLEWVTSEGERWIDETRDVGVVDADPERGWYRLAFHFRMRNISGKELTFGSPTTEGRPNAGYCSLFWRGPRSFLDGKILAAGGLEGPGIMGKRAEWLAYIGKHDETGRTSTLVFVDDERNVRHPNEWFVRNTVTPVVSCSFAFSEYFALPPKEELRLRYSIVVADGEPDPAGLVRACSA